MRFIFTLILAGCFHTISFAQIEGIRQKKIDSLKLRLEKDSLHIFRPRLAKPYLRLENRNSFISKESVNLLGFLAGATFIEKHIVCAGYYTLNRRVQKSIEFIDNNNVITREFLLFDYFVFCYQYIVLNKRFLQIHTPLEIGYGPYSSKSINSSNNTIKKSDGNIIPLSLGVQFIFKPIRWLGISTVGGYRYAKQEENINLNFTGFYYSFGVWIDARHLSRLGRYHLKKKEFKKALKAL